MEKMGNLEQATQLVSIVVANKLVHVEVAVWL